MRIMVVRMVTIAMMMSMMVMMMMMRTSPIFFPLYNLETGIICACLTIASHKTILLLQSEDDEYRIKLILIKLIKLFHIRRSS